jgi:hypothetical protein
MRPQMLKMGMDTIWDRVVVLKTTSSADPNGLPASQGVRVNTATVQRGTTTCINVIMFDLDLG